MEIYDIKGQIINPGTIQDGWIHDRNDEVVGFVTGEWLYTLDGKVIGFFSSGSVN